MEESWTNITLMQDITTTLVRPRAATKLKTIQTVISLLMGIEYWITQADIGRFDDVSINLVINASFL